MYKKILLIIGLCLLIPIARGEVVSSNSERVCQGTQCVQTIYSSPRYDRDPNTNEWKNITDILNYQLVSGNVKISYSDKYWVLLEPYVIKDDNKYTMSQALTYMRNNYPDADFNIKNFKNPSRWKYALNFSEVNLSDISGLQYIGLNLVDSHGLTWNDVVKDGNTLIVKDKVVLSFDDLVDSNFTVTMNKSDILIGNLHLGWLDPKTTIKANDTDAKAYDDSVASNGATPCTIPYGSEFGSADYLAVGASDDSRAEYDTDDDNLCHIFNFTLPSYSSLDYIYYSWEGQTGLGLTSVFIFGYYSNASGTGWEQHGTDSSGEVDDILTTNITVNPTHFVNTTDNTFQCQGMGNSRVRTDYAYITFSYTPSNVAPVYSSNTSSLANGTDYNPSNNYGFEINFTDTDGNFDNATFATNLNDTWTNYTASNTTKDIFYINFTQIPVGIYGYQWYGIDTSNSENSTDNMTYHIDHNTSGAISAFSLNDTYININETLIIDIASSLYDTILVEVQTTGGTNNRTATYSSTGNYTFDFNKTYLGDTQGNATTVNITNLYFGGNNYTSSSNTSTLSFTYAKTELSVSHSPSGTVTPGTLMYIYADYNTTENNDIHNNCSFTIGALSYDMTYDSIDARHEGTAPTTGWASQVYTYSVSCVNNSYQTQTDSGTFNLQAGEAGTGSGNGGGGGGGAQVPILEIYAHLGEYCDNETACAEGLVCEENVCISPTLEFCGNNFCDFGETFLNCPQDCPSQSATVAQAQFLIIAGSLTYVLVFKPKIVKKRQKKRRYDYG